MLLSTLREWRTLDRFERAFFFAPAILVILAVALIWAYGARHSGTVIAHNFEPAHRKCTSYAHGTTCADVAASPVIEVDTALGTSRMRVDAQTLAQHPVGSYLHFWPTITVSAQ